MRSAEEKARAAAQEVVEKDRNPPSYLTSNKLPHTSIVTRPSEEGDPNPPFSMQKRIPTDDSQNGVRTRYLAYILHQEALVVDRDKSWEFFRCLRWEPGASGFVGTVFEKRWHVMRCGGYAFAGALSMRNSSKDSWGVRI